LRVLSDTAHLLADGNSDPRVSQDLEDAVNQPACAALDMPVTRCEALINVGRLWLGWIAMREARLADAGQWFSTFPNSGWPALIEGRRAMEVRQYAQAVGAFRRALENFGHAPNGGWAAAISPHPDEADTWFRLGSAEFEAKDYTSAVTSLERAVKLRPENARAIFERARAREMLGQSGLADYELASRTAFANVNAPGAGGQAHMFHGVALYRRRDFERAEQEFSSSLNFDAGWAKDDAVAWRHMAAVAGGACGQSAAQLRQSLEHVSDYFPRDEASGLIRTCPTAISEVVHPVAQ
jgi:tetratricopeptide (TPR) repeat protein